MKYAEKKTYRVYYSYMDMYGIDQGYILIKATTKKGAENIFYKKNTLYNEKTQMGYTIDSIV